MLWVDWEVHALSVELEQFLNGLLMTAARDQRLSSEGWLVLGRGERTGYSINPSLQPWLDRVVRLANYLLPDFITGQVSAHVTAASLWDTMPRVLVEVEEEGAEQCADFVEHAPIALPAYANAIAEQLGSLLARKMS